MIFIQKLPSLPTYQDTVSITTLPHPISMFLLGFTLFALLIIYIEYRRLASDLKEFKENIREIKKSADHNREFIEIKMSELSKKLDSRVDKAILSVKKSSKTVL
jgi:hypothetical protein